jgi:alpha-tubulin suppressor-like RCC1 family protein/PKD repeat protein
VLTRRRVACAAAALVMLGLTAPGPAGARVPVTTAAIAAPGGVPWTWGGNGFGQLGNGTTQPRLVPGPVTGLSDVVDLHGGREHVAALRDDGTVWTWGSNQQGQLGVGGTANRSTPTQVPGLAGVTAVETGHNSSLALLDNGTVRTWGLNTDGQLGDGTTTLRRTPVSVVGLNDAVAIAAGRNMSYALRADGTVVAWGRNDEGQLGDGTRTRRTTPVRVGSLTNVVGIAGGRDHGLVLRDDGTVWAWGSNDYGQVGDGSMTDRVSPVQVTSGVLEVIAGAHHSYALRADHTVAAWGRNYRANLGDGTTTTRTRPVSVRSLSSVASIGSGRDTGMAVLTDGRVMAWGSNAFGQVGDGTTVNRATPVFVQGIEDAVLAGGGGSEYAVALVAPTTTPPPPQDPAATFTSSCDGTLCSFDASGSGDPDGGTLVGYDWTFGDGESETFSSATTEHGYAAVGTYLVTLTVTDDEGATGSVTEQVVVEDEPPPPVGPEWRATASSDSNTARPVVNVPGSVQASDRLVLFVTTNRAATLTTPTGWTLLGTVSDGTDMRSWALTRAAGPGLAGNSLTLTLDATSKTSLVLLAFSGAAAPSAWTSRAEPGSTNTHTAPAAAVAQDASRVVRYYVDKTSTVHGWTLAPVLVSRATTTGSGSGFLVAVAGDQAGIAAGTATALDATSGVGSSKAVAWTLVLPPG